MWETGNQYPEYWRLLEDQKGKGEIWGVFIKHTCANRLDLVELSVLPKVVVESIVLVPELVVDDRGQMLDFLFEKGNVFVIGTTDDLCNLNEDFCREDLLNASIHPNHVTVGERNVIARFKAGHIVHSAAPARRPIGAVAPSTELFQPQMVCKKRVKNLFKTFYVTRLRVIFPLRSTETVGARGGGIVTRKMLACAEFAELAANVAVFVLV